MLDISRVTCMAGWIENKQRNIIYCKPGYKTNVKHTPVLYNICVHADSILRNWKKESKTAIMMNINIPLNTLRTGDADLRLYVTTVQDR